MKYINYVMLIMLSILAPISLADCNAIGCTTKITKLYITETPEAIVYIKPASNEVDNLNCALKENTYITLKKTHPLFKEVYSAALAATMSDRVVRLRINENTVGCALKYIML